MVARSVLWDLIALAGEVPTLTDERLRFRLVALAALAARESGDQDGR